MDFFNRSNHNSKYIYSLDKLHELRSNNDILDPQEQVVLFKFYHSKINQICLHFHHNRIITYNAHWLFRRVFLFQEKRERKEKRESNHKSHDHDHDHSIYQMDTVNPQKDQIITSPSSKPLKTTITTIVTIAAMLFSEIKIVMLSCILLSAKSNNCHMEANDLAQISNINVNLIRETELKLLSFLDFDLFFFNPYYSISSLLSSLHINNHDDKEGIIWKEMDELATCDIPLILSPSIIALTLVYRHYKSNLIEWLFEQQDLIRGNIIQEQIEKILEESLLLFLDKNVGLAFETIDNKKLKQIDKKIKEKLASDGNSV